MTELNQSEVKVTPDSTAPLTNWKNPPNLMNLKQHLEDARQIHAAQKTKIDEWTDNLNITGSAVIKTPDNASKVQPKLIRKQAEWRYPALSEPFLSTSDIFNVKGVTWEDREAAKQNQLVLNHQFNTKINKVKFIDTYVRTGVDEGTVILKTSWITEEEKYETEEPVYTLVQDPGFNQTIQEIEALKQSSPSQYQTDVPDELKAAHTTSMQYGVAYRPEVSGTQRVTKTRVIKNHPHVEVCDYRNTIIDPTAYGVIENANFVIHSFETSMSELQKDGRYKNLDLVLVSNNSPLNEPDHTSELAMSNFNFKDKPRAKITVYEYWGYWDIDGTGLVKPIVAAWIGNQLIRMEENPFPDKKLPFVLVPYLPVRRSNYGEPDGALLLENQKIIGAVTRGMVDLMGKSANAQTGVRKGALDVVNLRKFESGKDYEFNPAGRPEEIFYMHKFPEIPQSAPLMLQMMNQEAESLTGVKSFTNGVTGNSLGDVAAGIRGALDASSKRETAILRRMAQGIIEVGRKFISMNSQFLSEEEVIRITNEEYVTVRRDDLAGDFDLELSISTAEEDDNKARELVFMLQTLGPNEDPTMRAMILSDICRLRKMPDLAHKIENFKPEPDPMQVKLQELEIAKIEAEIAEIQAKAAQLRASAGLHDQKANTEVTKQGKTQSETDQKNLDFVEQESGVKQERELQKQAEKEAARAQTEVLKASLAKKDEAKEK